MNLIKRSPYHHKLVALGATFVDRLGFPSPMTFTSTEEEHRATRIHLRPIYDPEGRRSRA